MDVRALPSAVDQRFVPKWHRALPRLRPLNLPAIYLLRQQPQLHRHKIISVLVNDVLLFHRAIQVTP